jgi:hypothetical protein
LFTSGAALALGLTVAYAPFFKNTKEGIVAAWNWNKNGLHHASKLADAWLWHFFVTMTGLFAGMSATQAVIIKSIQKPAGAWLMWLSVPLSVFGGVLGAALTTSTAGPVTDFIVFSGRLTEFIVEGIMADFFNKPHKELSWVRHNRDLVVTEIIVKDNRPRTV